jgi:hypothetical protein
MLREKLRMSKLSIPQGQKPTILRTDCGATKVVPFQHVDFARNL